MMQTLPMGGEFMQTYSPLNALVGQNSLLVAIRPGRAVPRQARPETEVGADGMGSGGATTSPDCSTFTSMAPFILPYVDLSMCSPMCHT